RNSKLSLLFCLLVAGCTGNQQTAEIPQQDNPSPSIKPTGNQPGRISEEASKEPRAETYKVRFETSKGNFVVEVHPEWAPQGADRFRNLIEEGFYDQTRFFRVLPDFMVQWGINGDPQVQSLWRNRNIPDDRVRQTNKRGTITFATSGPNSRTTQVFINYKNNRGLDRQGFSPFGQVVEGMDVVDKINAEHREEPDQGQIQIRGNEYLNEKYPNLDYIKSAKIIE
ncbi:MAG: peptidylprolyl isomerase, partial [Planctomycetaceae bacterium]|nr:peptidylprolyl isomerase [Planctomycetaceae bacterium]